MSRSHYSLNQEQSFTIRGTAKLLNAASARYGGDWHSVPHTHNHMELFFIVGGKGQFLIEDQLHPVDVNNLVIINPNVVHTEVSLNAQPLEYIVLGVAGIQQHYKIIGSIIKDMLEECLAFYYVEEIMDVPGIGEKRFEELKAFITCIPAVE